MLSSKLFSDSLTVLPAIIPTAIVCWVFFKMSISYTQKRAHQRYAENKQKAPSIRYFTHLSKILFVSAIAITLLSYWWQFPTKFLLHNSTTWRLIGVAFVFFGYLGLSNAFATLDENYSPLFDAYKPFDITTSGVYGYIRHPIYLFNLCVSFGLALSSGVILVLGTALIGFVFVLNAIFIEERFLKQQFTDYRSYCKRTWRLVPYLF